MVARARRLNGCVQGQQVVLIGNLIDMSIFSVIDFQGLHCVIHTALPLSLRLAVPVGATSPSVRLLSEFG